MTAEMRKEYAKVIAKAWTDADFKDRLLQDPAAVLQENGILVSSEEATSFALPAMPAELLGGTMHKEMGIHTCP